MQRFQVMQSVRVTPDTTKPDETLVGHVIALPVDVNDEAAPVGVRLDDFAAEVHEFPQNQIQGL